MNKMSRPWPLKNWKWFLLIGVGFIFLLSVTVLKARVPDMVSAYTDESLYSEAISLANENQEVLSETGRISPLEDLAILEGESEYSNGGNLVKTTVRFTSEKCQGRMDIAAHKEGTHWVYDQIDLRTTDPARKIEVVHHP